MRFDQDGELADRGSCSADALVERWLSHAYYQQQPPKSTGRELFSQALAEQYRQEAAADRTVDGRLCGHGD